MKEWNEKARRGPLAFISVKAEGIEPGMARPMAMGFLLNIVIAAILSLLVRRSTCNTILHQALFIGLCGSVGALYPHISNLLWWHFPVSYTLVGVFDLWITWTLAGFGMAALSRKLS